MIRIIIHGCCGRMGHIITEICEKDEKTQVVAGVDAFGDAYAGFPVYRDLNDCPEADVVIDFSTASAIDGLLAYCTGKKLPVVVCTTGLSEEQTKALHSAAEKIAVLKSANMSVGVNLIEVLIAQAAPKLAQAGFDIEIVEKHHNRKLDAPSGTAIMIADAAASMLDTPTEYMYDRHSVRQKRGKQEIGICSVRGGTIVGEHNVIFAGTDEVLEISHTAYSREIFANGAVRAAEFLYRKSIPGLYNMEDLVLEVI